MPGIGAQARSLPDAVALVSPGVTRTFEELDARQRSLAGALRSTGLARGDRIAVLSGNRTELLEVTIGALRAGIVPVPINPGLTPPEIAYILEDSGAEVLFTDRGIDVVPAVARVVTFGDAYERMVHEASPVKIADVALGRPMHYTSGTTGRPKGVWVEPHNEQIAASLSVGFASLWGLTSDDVHLVCSPLAHSAPHRFALRTLEAGGRVVLQGKFDPAGTLAAIEFFGITSTFMVPTHLERIFALSQRVVGGRDVSSLRLLAHAGASIRDSTKRRTIDLFSPGVVWEFYGSTEGQATRVSSDEWLERPGTVGRALPGGEVIVTDDGGKRVPTGEVGWVWVKDPSRERWRYWGDDQKTRDRWRKDAFCVGDLGMVDTDGYLFLAGRGDDTIITGGVNVYPLEIEQVLTSHPAVTEALVYPVEHDEWGQEVRAFVVPAFGQPLDAELLRAWARERLAGFKCPRVIEIVDDLPRTPTGKLRRPT